MSVTGPSFNINAINKLAELELKHGTGENGSWHDQYKDSCYIFVGGLAHGLNEGDIAIVFSQWGEPIDIHLVRDQKTGCSRGFAFIGYEDQRSTILAVDNFNGYELLGRRLRVDHCKGFRPPKQKDGKDGVQYKPSGAEGQGYQACGVTEHVKGLIEARGLSHNPTPSEHLATRDTEELWAEEFEEMLKREKKKRKIHKTQARSCGLDKRTYPGREYENQNDAISTRQQSVRTIKR